MDAPNTILYAYLIRCHLHEKLQKCTRHIIILDISYAQFLSKCGLSWDIAVGEKSHVLKFTSGFVTSILLRYDGIKFSQNLSYYAKNVDIYFCPWLMTSFMYVPLLLIMLYQNVNIFETNVAILQIYKSHKIHIPTCENPSF